MPPLSTSPTFGSDRAAGAAPDLNHRNRRNETMSPKSFDIPDIPDIPGLDDDDPGSGGGGGGGRRAAGGGQRGRRRRWPWLLAGIVIGILGTLFVPGLIRPYLPAALRGNSTRVRGLVVAKGMENGQLLLTVDTGEGALLATFESRVPEIDLLVSKGDSVTLGLPAYRPFVKQPDILGVKKFPGGAPSASGAAPATAGVPAAGTLPSRSDTAIRRDTLPPTKSGSDTTRH